MTDSRMCDYTPFPCRPERLPPREPLGAEREQLGERLC